MYQLIFSPLDAPFGALLLVILLAGAAVYWWARKSAHHPGSAAGKEAEIDALLERAIASEMTPAALDRLLGRLRDVELVEVGKASYTQLAATASKAERVAHELNVISAELRSRMTKTP